MTTSISYITSSKSVTISGLLTIKFCLNKNSTITRITFESLMFSKILTYKSSFTIGKFIVTICC